VSEVGALTAPVPPPTTSGPAELGPSVSAGAFWGLLNRDLRVLLHNLGQAIGQTVTQPLLFVFVFAYVFPKIGQGFTGGSAKVSFATILVPGLVAVSALFTGISAVALPLSVEFGSTKEIEDRAMAPLPVWAVGAEKVIFGACQSLFSALLVFPLAYFIPATSVSVHVHSWPLVVGMVLLACLTSGALGLVLGCLVKPQHIGLMFGLLVIPLSFLGCVYYPWAALHSVRWLQDLVLVNPLVYLSEGLRAALTPAIPHMAPGAFLGVGVAIFLVLFLAGLRLFIRRVVT